jgi:hypothetical protein
MLESIVGTFPLVISQSAATLVWLVSLLVLASTTMFTIVNMKELSVEQRRTLWILCLMSSTGTVIPFQIEAVYFTVCVFLFFVVSLHRSYLHRNMKLV